ncbi:MAG: YicC family protein [Bacteroidetes bacterium]|nr:YicC family protein [Bacteroidota bacterium]
MMKSMTGFSKVETSSDGIKLTVEIKSLNGKGFDINFRMPRQLSSKEIELRDLFRKQISRGSVSVYISIESDNAEKKFAINQDIAQQCYDELTQLRKKFKFRDAINLNHLLNFSSIISQNDNTLDEEFLIELLKKNLKESLKNLDTMRLREGKNITKDIVQRMKKVQGIVEKIQEISQNRIPQEREKLRNKIAQIFDSDEIDEHRLQMEIVLLADKLDVSEECVRLASHFKFFFEAIKSPEPAGRKINFLLQEFNREINTIGSKANDAVISQYVVTAKEELERVREQIQNIE